MGNSADNEIIKQLFAKINEIQTEIYNKHIFGYYDLADEEKDAVINFSDDVTYALDKLKKKMLGED